MHTVGLLYSRFYHKLFKYVETARWSPCRAYLTFRMKWTVLCHSTTQTISSTTSCGAKWTWYTASWSLYTPSLSSLSTTRTISSTSSLQFPFLKCSSFKTYVVVLADNPSSLLMILLYIGQLEKEYQAGIQWVIWGWGWRRRRWHNVCIYSCILSSTFLFAHHITSQNEDDADTVRVLTSNEAKNLAHYLKVKVLPGLNESERIHLIAMVDTIVEVSCPRAPPPLASTQRLMPSRLLAKATRWTRMVLDLQHCSRTTFI